jgi:hypothetical protein
MNNLVATSIKAFGVAPEADFETIEIAVSDFQNIMAELAETYNLAAEALRKSGAVRGRDLARMATAAQEGLKAASSPVEKILLWSAHFRRLLAATAKAMAERPQAAGPIRKAITKIQLRAEALVGHIKTLAAGKERISLASPQAREYLAGMEGKPVSRRDCIRALHRAEKICPALVAGHVGGRATMRLTAKVSDIVASGNGPGWMA